MYCVVCILLIALLEAIHVISLQFAFSFTKYSRIYTNRSNEHLYIDETETQRHRERRKRKKEKKIDREPEIKGEREKERIGGRGVQIDRKTVRQGDSEAGR